MFHYETVKNTEGKSLRILFSYILNPGQPVIGNSKAWLGRFGEVGHPYTHPTAKQCSYAYTHPSTKQCNYTYTHPSTKQCNYSVDTSGFATTAQLNEVKTSVSNGKSAIASAITDKGVSTAASADFSTMASNIRSIQVNEPHIIITQPQLSLAKISKLSLKLSSSSSEFSKLLSLTRNTYKLQMSLYVYFQWVSNMGYGSYVVISSTVGSNALTLKWEDLNGGTSPGRTANYIIYDDWIEFSCCSNFGELRACSLTTTQYLSADSWLYV